MPTLTVLGVRICMCKAYPHIWMCACRFSPWTSTELILQKHPDKCPYTSFRQKQRIIWKLGYEDLNFLTDLLILWQNCTHWWFLIVSVAATFCLVWGFLLAFFSFYRTDCSVFSVIYMHSFWWSNAMMLCRMELEQLLNCVSFNCVKCLWLTKKSCFFYIDCFWWHNPALLFFSFLLINHTKKKQTQYHIWDINFLTLWSDENDGYCA